MDISESLKSCRNIKNNLKDFPKYKRNPVEESWYPKKHLYAAHTEILSKCIPFLNKIVKDTKQSLMVYNESDFKEILDRRKYIQTKLQESQQNKNVEERRKKLITEIEKLKGLNNQKIEKLKLDESRTMTIIEHIHESACPQETTLPLNLFIEFSYDQEANKCTDSYEKILKLFQR